MGNEYVTSGIDALFAAFHRPAPRAEVYAHLGNVADDLRMTPDAIEAAFAGLRCRPKLPENLELELRESWRAWCEAGGIGPAMDGACSDCGGTGWIMAWRPGARPGDGPLMLPCACNAAGEQIEGITGGVRTLTKGELMRAGWTFSWPEPAGARPASRDVIRAAAERAVREDDASRAPEPFVPHNPFAAPAPEPVQEAEQYDFFTQF